MAMDMGCVRFANTSGSKNTKLNITSISQTRLSV